MAAASASWTYRAHCSCYFLVILANLAVLTLGSDLLDTGAASVNELEGCSAVRSAYASKGFNSDQVPAKMITGVHLRTCPQGFTCCTAEMEHHLSAESRAEYDKIMAEKISLIRNTFVSRAAKFDAFFTELLDNSKQDLHEMFVKTYGLLYQQNSAVFTDLFRDLRSYYKGRDINLLDALDNFFSTLMQKMFQLMNTQYTFDQEYLQCVTERMDDLRPFGDVPQKLSMQVKRAFIAARTFVQGLAIGRDVILAVSKIEPTNACMRAQMKMLHCPYCRGLPGVKPCNNYCMNVLKGCLASQADLNEDWNNYITEMMKVAERLEGPFNIEAVVDPIDVKISDAIMNFQENGETVTTKVFSGCGQPYMGRKKRDTGGRDHWKSQRRAPQARPTTALGTSLDRLVRDIKNKIRVAEDFWKDLPHAVCNDVAAPITEEHKCWNGLARGRYIPEVMRDGTRHQNNNPEVDVDVRHPNSVIEQQVLQLRIITNKLRSAYNGHDVDWIDTAPDFYGSGSGDGGSGSGDGGGSGDGFRPSDDISFRQSTWQPPIVMTRRPPARENNNNPYTYDEQPSRTGSGAQSSSPLYTGRLLTLVMLVCGMLGVKLASGWKAEC